MVSTWKSVESLEALIGRSNSNGAHADLLNPTRMVKLYEVIAFTLVPADQDQRPCIL